MGKVFAMTLPTRGAWTSRDIRESMLLYAVTDRAWLNGRSLGDCVRAVVRGGATFVQLREKHASQDEVEVLARELLNICRQNGVPFVIDDDVQLALKAQADGADYLGVGAMFGTPTKTDAKLVSFDDLRAICQAVEIPSVAIGGLNASTVTQLAGTGVDGAAVVSALFAADDCEKAARELRAVLEGVAL